MNILRFLAPHTRNDPAPPWWRRPLGFAHTMRGAQPLPTGQVNPSDGAVPSDLVSGPSPWGSSHVNPPLFPGTHDLSGDLPNHPNFQTGLQPERAAAVANGFSLAGGHEFSDGIGFTGAPRVSVAPGNLFDWHPLRDGAGNVPMGPHPNALS